VAGLSLEGAAFVFETGQPYAALALANLVTFIAAFVQTATGLGFAMVAVPLLAIIHLDFVPGPSLFASVFLALTMLVGGRSAIVGTEVLPMFPALAAGTVLGAIVLAVAPTQALGALFALAILVAVAVTILARPFALSSLSLVCGGFAAGLMGTVSGIHGPPLVVLYQKEAVEKTRATLALIFLIGYVISLAALAAAGHFDLRRGALGLQLLPGLFLGFAAARQARGLLPAGVVRASMLAIASISAIVLLAKSWA
jgi:hypothetical protein